MYTVSKTEVGGQYFYTDLILDLPLVLEEKVDEDGKEVVHQIGLVTWEEGLEIIGRIKAKFQFRGVMDDLRSRIVSRDGLFTVYEIRSRTRMELLNLKLDAKEISFLNRILLELNLLLPPERAGEFQSKAAKAMYSRNSVKSALKYLVENDGWNKEEAPKALAGCLDRLRSGFKKKPRQSRASEEDKAVRKCGSRKTFLEKSLANIVGYTPHREILKRLSYLTGEDLVADTRGQFLKKTRAANLSEWCIGKLESYLKGGGYAFREPTPEEKALEDADMVQNEKEATVESAPVVAVTRKSIARVVEPSPASSLNSSLACFPSWLADMKISHLRLSYGLTKKLESQGIFTLGGLFISFSGSDLAFSDDEKEEIVERLDDKGLVDHFKTVVNF